MAKNTLVVEVIFNISHGNHYGMVFWVKYGEYSERWGFGWICQERKTCEENFFQINAEWSSKMLQKMISADVKANVKKQEMKEPVAESCNFL